MRIEKEWLGRDDESPVGASRVGGEPDLPPGFAWPTRRDCRAALEYGHDLPAGREDEPAQFFGQINFAELRGTQAARLLRLPETGLLSMFQSRWWGEPVGWGGFGLAAFFSPDPTGLTRVRAPEGADEDFPSLLTFRQALEVPTDACCPWTQDYGPEPASVYADRLWPLDHELHERLFGYEFETDGCFGDYVHPPSRRMRHFLTWECGNQLIETLIDQADLDAHHFGALRLYWVKDNT